MKLATLVWYVFPGLLVAQNLSITGTVNGKQIPDDYLNPSHEHLQGQFAAKYGHNPSEGEQALVNTTVLTDWQCNKLHAMIRKAARDAVIQQFGIAVTQQDLETASKLFPISVGDTGTMQMLLNALSAVYDNHEDPEIVYNRMLAGKIPHNLWLMQLNEASTPEGRSKLETKYQSLIRLAPKIVSSPRLEYWQSTVINNKLNEAVDQELARIDPTFRAYLEATPVNKQGVRTNNWSTPQGRYLAQRRQDFWTSQDSKVDVYLSDPSIGKACGLPQYTH